LVIENQILGLNKRLSMNPDTWARLLQLLEDSAERLRQLEAEARNNLYLRRDNENYRRLQLEKTNLLILLPENVESLLSFLAPALRTLVAEGLEEFASEARTARSLNSIFYMSVLLFPESDDGNISPNSFDLFVETVRSAAGK